jgi:hypothetical protein
VYTNKAPKASRQPVGDQERTDETDFNKNTLKLQGNSKAFWRLLIPARTSRLGG